MPTQAYVGRSISLHPLRRQRAHMTVRLLKLQVFGQIQKRLDGELVGGARALRGSSRAWILAAGFVLQIEMQVGIRTLQAPPAGRPPVWCDLNSRGRARQPVAKKIGQN